MRDLPSSLHYAVELLSTMAAITKKKMRPVSLREVISKNEKMSLHFLEQIARKIRISGIISVVRGPGGGYLFAKDVMDITVADLLNAGILRHASNTKQLPPFKTSKALESIYNFNMDKFKETLVTDLKGFGLLQTRSK